MLYILPYGMFKSAVVIQPMTTLLQVFVAMQDPISLLQSKFFRVGWESYSQGKTVDLRICRPVLASRILIYDA